jgi:hypothetical protein
MKIQNRIYNGFLKLLIAAAALQTASYSQDGILTVNIDPQKPAANEQFQVIFTFSGSDNSLRNFKAPDFSKFVVISGPNQSTRMELVNGSASVSISYTFVLYARQSGKYNIGAATADYKGKKIQSEPVQLEVLQASQRKQSQKQNSQSENLDIGDNIFIKVYTDRSHLRKGAQLTLTFKLYTRLSISSYDISKAPTFDGFWGEDFEMPKQPQVTTETINGKQYKSVIIKKTALFATQSGSLKIAPLEVRCAVQVQTKRRGNDLFDSFFNDPFFQSVQTVNVDIKSNPLTIVVDPLPVNAPSGFSGAIGHFTFDAEADRHTVKAGDPITLKLTVSGSGNIRLITLPKPELPADMESYEPKLSDEINRSGGMIRGKKVAEYLIIPRNPGTRAIEPLKFVYFDLDRNEYITLKSPRFEFTIEPGKDFSGSGINIAAKEDVRLLGEDIRFIKLTMGNIGRADEDDSSAWLVFFTLFPPLIFCGAWYYRRRMEKIYGDMPKLLFKTAGREASRRLGRARALLEQGNTESYHAEILAALTQYLEHKLNIRKSNMVMDSAMERLRSHGVKDNIVSLLGTCIERTEFVRYAPASDTAKARKELLDMAADAISGIEQTFNSRRKS